MIPFIFLFCWQEAGAQNAEQRFLEHLTRNRSAGMTSFMQGVSNSTTVVSLAMPAGMWVVSVCEHDPVGRQKSLYVLETMAVGGGFALVLKYIVNRPRPSTRDSLIIPLSDMGSPSFPSGHSSLAFSSAMAMSLACPKWYVIVPSFLWAGTVGFSRMYLGVHYPTDVLAGALIGTGSALLCRRVNQWLFQPRPGRKAFVWY